MRGTFARLSRRVDLLAALSLASLYAAVMNGHLQSIDGLTMYRQGQSLAYQGSLHFPTPLWWGASGTTSKFGLGLSLLYVPGLWLWSGMRGLIPVQHGQTYDFSLLYADPVYLLASAPVQILIAAASAYLVARFIRELGFGTGPALAGLVLYGVASPAIAYARGDVAQPLVGLCWIVALYAAVRYRRTAGRLALLAITGAEFYAILTRPVDGALLFVALLVLLVPWSSPRSWTAGSWRRLLLVGAGFGAGLGVTLLVDWGRYGSPFATGYEGEGWTTFLPVGIVGSLLSPARGILWSFPAVILAAIGAVALWRTRRREVVALTALCGLQLLNVAAWHDWFGGWNWGLRLFVPALPVIAVLAGAGVAALRGRTRVLVTGIAFAAGVLWAVPTVVTDLLGGYGGTYAGTRASFLLHGYPPLGAWAFFHHWRAQGVLDSNGADILWLRMARTTHNLSLLALLLLAGLAALLAVWVARLVRRSATPTLDQRVKETPPGAPTLTLPGAGDATRTPG
jgi:hypothetical protein